MAKRKAEAATETTEIPAAPEVPGAPRYLVQKDVWVVFGAETPIKHLQETVGNHGIAHGRKVLDADGYFVRVHDVSANAMRNRCRYAAVMATLRAADLIGEGLPSEDVERALFNGGVLQKAGGTAKIAFDYFREIATLVPPLALFGGCSDGHMLEGRVYTSAATLICAESLRSLPPFVRAWLANERGYAAPVVDGEAVYEEAAVDAYLARMVDEGRVGCSTAHIDIQQGFQQPVASKMAVRALLSDGAQVKIHQRLAAREAASRANDPEAIEATKDGPRPYSYETICQGSLLSWRIGGTFDSPLLEDAFYAVLHEVLSVGPKVGGGSNNGDMGRLRARKGWGYDVVPVRYETTEIRGGMGDLFRAHVKDRRDDLRAWMRRVVA